MAAVGTSVEIADEALMDVVTAVSGSGPAYVVLLAEAWQTAAQAQGLSADAARALVNQTLLGAARMLLETNETATTLRQRASFLTMLRCSSPISTDGCAMVWPMPRKFGRASCRERVCQYV